VSRIVEVPPRPPVARKTNGRVPPAPPERGWGGDDERDGTPPRRLDNLRLALLFFMGAEVMFFAALVSALFVLRVGMAAWTSRYALFAFGTHADLVWMLYAGILLHGICYDFFFMTGQLYTDQEASADLRGTAQGLITFLTYGVGMFAGSLLSGGAVDYFTKNVGAALVRNWMGFWLSSALSALAIFVFVLIGFRNHDKVRTKQDELVVA